MTVNCECCRFDGGCILLSDPPKDLDRCDRGRMSVCGGGGGGTSRPGAAEEGRQRGQLPIQNSVERRLSFGIGACEV